MTEPAFIAKAPKKSYGICLIWTCSLPKVKQSGYCERHFEEWKAMYVALSEFYGGEGEFLRMPDEEFQIIHVGFHAGLLAEPNVYPKRVVAEDIYDWLRAEGP